MAKKGKIYPVMLRIDEEIWEAVRYESKKVKLPIGTWLAEAAKDKIAQIEFERLVG